MSLTNLRRRYPHASFEALEQFAEEIVGKSIFEKWTLTSLLNAHNVARAPQPRAELIQGPGIDLKHIEHYCLGGDAHGN